MHKLLERAGVSPEVLALIPDIVDTCASCRQWQKPQPAAQAHVELADTFNAQVECDLMFVKQYIIMHFVDRCTRWHHALEVKSKDHEEMIFGIDDWCRIHGPMKELISDNEGGIVKSEATRDYCKQKGITLKPRAVYQQLSLIHISEPTRPY